MAKVYMYTDQTKRILSQSIIKQAQAFTLRDTVMEKARKCRKRGKETNCTSSPYLVPDHNGVKVQVSVC